MACVPNNRSVSREVEGGLVRFGTGQGEVVGVGFLTGGGRVLTCAHVVARAVGIADDAPQPPVGPVALEFPFAPASGGQSATVEVWWPPGASMADPGAGDVAVLRLTGPAPGGATPLRAAVVPELWDHEVRAIGYPAGGDPAEWASARVRGRVSPRWVQLVDTVEPGPRILQGYSGGPVWDAELGAVVGMVVA